MTDTNQSQKIIYYKDELNDEFSTAVIQAKRIDGNYRYLHKTVFGSIIHFILYRLVAAPISWCYLKLKFHHRIRGKEKLKAFRKQGYFVYGNHTQIIGDALIPSFVSFPKAAFVIVHPNNVSMKFLGKLNEYMGAMPLPDDMAASRNFIAAIKKRIEQRKAVFIYPEAHLWPYYTHIRPFSEKSFSYPLHYGTPVFCFTNVYKKRKSPSQVRIETFIDGPFFADEANAQDAIKKLRDEVYEAMVTRSQGNEVELVRYIKQ